MLDCPPTQISHQLALAIQLNDEASFANFCWGSNTLLHQQLQSALQKRGDRHIYIWGASGSGKSHLLQACCQTMHDHQQSAIYLPLKILSEWGPDAIEGITEHRLISIDDIDAIAGNPLWEEALFHLYNRIRDQETSLLIITGQSAPTSIPIDLADLRSRLSWGLVSHLAELTDPQKIQTLQLIATRRGFTLPTPVGEFLLSRCSRNMHDLHTLLNQLDDASLIAQRKITIPFVKSTLQM